MSETVLERMERATIPEPNSGCLLWLWAVYPSGYAVFAQGGGKSGYGRREAWKAHKGPIPPGLMVLHKCDVRCCVEINHLFLGTAKNNADDMVKKGRWGGRRKKTLPDCS